MVSFLDILWVLSGPLTVPLGAFSITIPGYMVWAALLYSICGTWLTRRVSRPLIRLNFDQQRYEADFRYSLVRLRENVEGVALYRGEADEARILRSRFAAVVGNWWAIMRRQKRLTWITAGYGQAAVIFPILAAAPRYFSGGIKLGGLMQTVSAFGQVQGSMSWFVDAFTALAEWKATVDRLTTFTTDMDAARNARSELSVTAGQGETLRVEDVDLTLPDGRPLLTGLCFELTPGDSLLIGGPSGCGKSTLLRAMAGLWPYGRGRIVLPEGRSLFLPQKPYLPIGDLRSVVIYPAAAAGFSDADIVAALTDCNLAMLTGHLDETRLWAQVLSPGEQQRLAFARLLLLRPRWLFLDEATSAMDEAGEEALYRLLRARLPAAAVVSVGHRRTLKEFHARHLQLAPARPAGGGTSVPEAWQPAGN